ncbi:hypothetical protein H6F61_21805 [Cyanobacteria bacterium FACHB-472]|nr:hypothetical protein [Cyanobacteria bacterium FACHB-472]
MGVSDKTNYTLSCERCAVSETVSVLDKGSGWGGSSWQAGKPFTNFTAQWKGGGRDEPEIVSATCNACGGVATSESKYGGL